jgi:D-glycero-D-manno-heptose 1,7-bisphosphate phosphatase
LETARDINRRIVEEVEHTGGRIDRVYMCPHAPWEKCDCRKPKPGLILQAAEELSLDLARSIMIGDALTDLFAAKAAGISRMGLVLTGRGASQAQLPGANSIESLLIFDDLMAALLDQRLIIEI